MLDLVVADEEILRDWLFEKRVAEAFFAMEGEKEVALRCIFIIFPRFLARAASILRTYSFLPEHRGKGYGKAILTHPRADYERARLREAGVGLP